MTQDNFLPEEFTGKPSQTEKVSVSDVEKLENYIQINVAKAKTVDLVILATGNFSMV